MLCVFFFTGGPRVVCIAVFPLATEGSSSIATRACSSVPNVQAQVLPHHQLINTVVLASPQRPACSALVHCISFVSVSILAPLTVTQPVLTSGIAIRFSSSQEAASLPPRAPHSGRASQPRTYLTTAAREGLVIEYTPDLHTSLHGKQPPLVLSSAVFLAWPPYRIPLS